MYQRILVAVDSVQESVDSALNGATALAGKNTEIAVLHVVEPQSIPYSVDLTFTGNVSEELEESRLKAARRHIERLCAPFGVDGDRIHITLGRPASEIHKQARDLGCDLLSIASHGRHGWKRVLGSTANAVLHGTPVDVLVSKLVSNGNSTKDES
ncbi:MAG: universal stress protein [Pseudomonadales bacterium]